MKIDRFNVCPEHNVVIVNDNLLVYEDELLKILKELSNGKTVRVDKDLRRMLLIADVVENDNELFKANEKFRLFKERLDKVLES